MSPPPSISPSPSLHSTLQTFLTTHSPSQSLTPQSPPLSPSPPPPRSPSPLTLLLTSLSTHHPQGSLLDASPSQGACSLTLLLLSSSPLHENPRILQLRPSPFHQDPRLLSAARALHGPSLVPALLRVDDSTLEGVQIVEMERMSGVPCREALPSREPGEGEGEGLRRLMGGLAGFFAGGFYTGERYGDGDGGEGNGNGKGNGSGNGLSGKVGKTLRQRLERLAEELPRGGGLRARAERVRDEVEGGGLEGLPVVLTHGDPVAGNFLVDGAWRLSGVVDWAEAEELPFGVGMQGLENFLGYREETEGGRWGWRYYAEAEGLRAWFWRGLVERIPELGRGEVRRRVGLARDVGVLLWHGFAWDGGRIDRVVGEGDWEEVEYLNAFLGFGEGRWD